MGITIISVSSPFYSNAAQSAIDCTLTTKELGAIPYTAIADDIEIWGQALWVELHEGVYGTIAPYVAPTLTASQQAANALAAGIVVTSSGTPELNGTYSLSADAQSNVNATITYIMLDGTFPGGGTTMPWVDQLGNAHLWPSLAEFKAFATAFANYVAAVSLYALSNGAAGSLPSNSVTIP